MVAKTLGHLVNSVQAEDIAAAAAAVDHYRMGAFQYVYSTYIKCLCEVGWVSKVSSDSVSQEVMRRGRRET